MKKSILSLLLLMAFVFSLSSCSVGGSRDKMFERTVSFYNENREAIHNAVETGDFSAIEKLEEVRQIEPGYKVRINMGGYGWVSEGVEYGFFYYPGDYLEVSKYVSDSAYKEYMEPTEDGGYISRDSVGDNYEYIRLIEDNFWFYEVGW